jgi:hypothetical protein
MRKRDILGVVVFLTIAFVLLMSEHTPHSVVKYDCGLAEISPDYPVAVKEACRKMRAERVK